jgi:uncharacterized protein
MKVKCPRCGKDVDFEHNRFRPFCSERCKLIDLGNWISGRYRIPTAAPDQSEEEDKEPPVNGEGSTEA